MRQFATGLLVARLLATRLLTTRLLAARLLATRLLATALLFLSPLVLPADQELDRYYARAKEAIEKERYVSAVEILEEAMKLYPQNAELNLMLADLYYDKKLYRLALQEYLSAQGLGEEDYRTLSQLARCYGQLNQEEDSIRTLEKILTLYPDKTSAIDDLGWMYFKTHQLEAGRDLVLEAVERLGPDRGLYMTLGTIYSGLYDYPPSRQFYLLAIEEAERAEDAYFASVAYYNLSLLEYKFYHFNSSFRYTEDSISSADRAPGHLARGELYQSRMDFEAALDEYNRALSTDPTPLSRVNLAQLFRKFGQLELARRHAEEVLASKDQSWMYYYGTDLPRHTKDVHEILADVYLGLARRERLKPETSPFKRLLGLWRSLKFRLTAYYHRQKFRLYSLQVGNAYLEEQNNLDAYWEFFKANEAYRSIALKYLAKARDIEVRLAPQSAAYYLQEEAHLLGRADLQEQALARLDPFWEKEAIFTSLEYLLPLLPRGSSPGRRVINRMYTINSGGLQQIGVGLPLLLQFKGDQIEGAWKRKLLRLLKKTGSEITERRGTEGFRYTLSLDTNMGKVSLTLSDGVGGKILDSSLVDTGSGSAGKKALELVRGIAALLY